jgi:hexulose-6-phosphate isomerase
MSHSPNRRAFLQSSALAAAGAALASSAAGALAADDPKPAANAAPMLKLRKAVKFSMIGEGATIKDKLELVKSLGFEGVEMDSPSDINRDEAKKAADETGIVIHGVIDSVHWKQRFSDPDPAVRAKGLEALHTAIDDAKFYGATTVLVVPGAVRDPKNENFEQCWERSQAEIKKAIPWAKDANVKIAIEVVWNYFITRPDQLVKYVDEFNDPTVGAYFDVTNMIRFGFPPQQWIKELGKRMIKFDFKAYSHARFMNEENPWVPIGEGDEPWPKVLKALSDVGYEGWATSEVKAGGREYLKDVAARMDQVLGLA